MTFCAHHFVRAKKAVGSFLTPTLLMPVNFRVGSFDGRLFCTYSAIMEKKAPSKSAHERKGTRKHFVLSWALFCKWAQNIPAIVRSECA